MIRRYDYTTIKSRLTELIQDKDQDQAWKDMWESSTGLIFIELLAAGEEHLGYYLERRVIENYINTAVLQSSVFNLAAEKGYTPSRKLAATATARVVFDLPVPVGLVIPRGSKIAASNPVCTFNDYAVSAGNTSFGLGDGSTNTFAATLARMEAGSLVILVDGVAQSFTDDGLGSIIGSDGSTIIGSINYETGATVVTLESTPAAGIEVTATYKQEIVISVVQGEFTTQEVLITEAVDYVELQDNFSEISDSYISVFVTNTVTSVVKSYTRATSGPARYREFDRVYFPRYSWEERLRLYFGDGNYGRQPYDDGDKISIEYLVTLGSAGDTSTGFSGSFSEGGPEIAATGLAFTGSYSVVAGALENGEDEEDIESVRTNAIFWYATGERAVAKQDYKYFIQSYPGISKAEIITESDVPDEDKPRFRNTVAFTAVDQNCEGIDEVVSYGDGNYVVSTRTLFDPTGTFTADGVLPGDTIFMIRGTYKVANVIDNQYLELVDSVAYPAPVANFSNEFYHITRLTSPTSQNVIAFMEPYKTLTIFIEYRPPIVIPLVLDVLVGVGAGYVTGDVLAEVYNNLITTFHPTYFDFNIELAKAVFWDVVMDTNGVQDATIRWTINGSIVNSDYWDTPSPNENRKIITLTDVNVSQRV